MIFNPEIEQMPIEELRKIQNERLQNMLQKVYSKVPFYKNAFDEAGVKPEDINGVEDLHKLPFTKKNHLRDNYPFGLFAEPKSEVIRLHCSSGTTGKPTVVGYTRNDIELFSEVVARSFFLHEHLHRYLKKQQVFLVLDKHLLDLFVKLLEG